MSSEESRPVWSGWTTAGRALVFTLSATSIWCLLAEFYGLCSMRTFTLWISLPAMTALAGLAVADRWFGGDRRLWRGVAIGSIGGLVAALAYDAFRLPFVKAEDWGIASVVPRMPLFKVFPRFGAMILGEPIEQAVYSWAAVLLGWTYHFSNGITFGIMYASMIAEPARRSWGWAVLLAVGLEMGMLLTPYASVFSIKVGPLFIAATLTAHLIFGVALGLFCRWWARRWPVATVA